MIRKRLAAIAFLFAVAAPQTAAAFPWMVKHEYAGCAQCHSDPSGAGVLTAYGRAQSEIIVRTPWGTRSDEWEPGFASKPFFGIVDLPQSLDLGFSSRSAQLVVEPEKGEGDSRFLQMQTDLRAHYRLGQARVYASLASSKSDLTDFVRITKNDEEDGVNLISREHWAGWAPSDQLLVRGGRMVLPFGVRQIEHTLWVREATRTDLNATSQYGLAASWSGEKLRTDVMAIAGNYAVSPDEYRERGYSGMVEWAVTPRYIVGASSLVARAEKGIGVGAPFTRMAHGAFARVSPHPMLVVLAEADFLSNQVDDADPVNGHATMLQADVEPFQGIHLVLTGETFQPGGADPQLGGWASLVWYFAPHMDVRVDAVRRSYPLGDQRGADRTHVNLYLFQLHFFL